MEEKQEFQLGDILYLVEKDYRGYWILHKETVEGIKKEQSGIYLYSRNVKALQRLCGHSLKEAQEIAVREFYLEVKGQIKNIRGLKEKE